MAQAETTEAQVFFQQKSEADRYLPEGPRPVVVDGRPALAWVNIQVGHDVPRGALHLRFWDSGEHRVIDLPARPGFMVPSDRPNVVLLGQEKEIGTLDLSTGQWTALAKIPDTNPRTIINDGNVAPGGKAVVFGTKDLQFKEPIAHLYLYSMNDRRIQVLADRQTCSNGKVFERGANDALLLYDIDTPRRVVTRYRLDVGRAMLHEEGVAVDLHHCDGLPDGMVDAGDRTAIIALYNPHRGGNGQALRCSLADGKVLEQFTLPGSPRVTCPLLVERGNATKVVFTTAVEGMPDRLRSTSPEAGNLFVADARHIQVPSAEIVRLA